MILAECWARGRDLGYLPLWQLAHLELLIARPAWRFAWQARQSFLPGLDAALWWKAAALLWHCMQATLPAWRWNPLWQFAHAAA